MRSLFRSTAVAAGLVLLAAGARADNLDRALDAHAKKLAEKLADCGYKSVGVLPFGLKIGDGKMQMNGGAINTALPEYLESALAQATALDKELVVLRNVFAEAVKVKDGDPNTEAGRKLLLAHQRNRVHRDMFAADVVAVRF